MEDRRMPAAPERSGPAHGLWGRLLDILFPPKCAFCGSLLPAGTSGGICAQCRTDLARTEREQPLFNSGGSRCVVPFYYGGVAKKAVRAVKFQDKPGRAAVLGHLLGEACGQYLAGEFDAVTYVPVHFWRRFRRGYDQSQELARAAARQLGAPLEKTLRKVRATPPQSSLLRPEQRRANVLGAYRALRPDRLRGRRFLLVDDVFTTGSTMAACAETLLAAGASGVVCAALAGGHRTGGEQERE